MRRRQTDKRRYIILILLLIIAVGAGWKFWSEDKPPVTNSSTNQTPSPSPASNQQNSMPIIDLQPTVDAWDNKQNGAASVVVYDLANHKTVASLNPDTQYFTASIYKLYVAYVGYQKIADGTYKPADPYLSGYNRLECLDAMIRDSYSPCGEKMWAELGKASLTTKLEAYGLKNTSMTGLYTSAEDAATILQRLFERRDLTKDHADAFLDSMKDQPATYRRGLPSGFSQSTVYNKVGWNGQIEWHDTAIVTLSNNRSYIVSVLTKNVGSANIADLAKAIERRLTQ